MAEMTPEERAIEGRITSVLKRLALENSNQNRVALRYHFRAAVEAERERCAKVAEDEVEPGQPDAAQQRMIEQQNPIDLVNAAVKQTKRNIATSIRARGKEQSRDLKEEMQDCYQFGDTDTNPA